MFRRSFVALGGVALTSRAFGATAPTSPMAEYERLTGGHIGVYAKSVATGHTLAWRANQRFVMCSTHKASLAALVLSRVDQGHDRLDDRIGFTAADIHDWYAPVAKASLAAGVLTVEQMCRAAVEQSDNTCAFILLDRVGGPQALTRFWRSLGDHETHLEDPEPILNRTPLDSDRDTTTPQAMASILQAIALGPTLAPASRALLLGWMKSCQTGLNRLRAGLPHDWVIGDKTGNNAADAAGDIAIAWPKPDAPIVMAVYTRGGKPNEAAFTETFREIGQLIAHKLVIDS